MSWGAAENLYSLWAMPLVGLFLLLALRKRRTLLARLGPLVGAALGHRAHRRHRTRLVAMFLGLSLVVVSLAQPRWGFRWQELKREGLSVVVVLDTSLSMAAEDVSPNRMDRAKREILDLADLLVGDRVGLVLFAGGAYPRLPLTLDYDSLRRMVKQTDTTSLRSQGSDLGAALTAAGKLLGAAKAADRAVIVISDGEDQLGKAEAAAEALVEDGVHIYAMGVGTDDGAPVPQAGGGFKKDASGSVVLSRLDASTLQRVAEIGGGAYVRSVAGNGDMRAIYGDEIRGKLHTAEQASRREKIWDERFQWPLGLGLFVFLVGFFARGPRGARGARTALPAALALWMVGAPAQAQDVESAGTIEALAAQQVERPEDLSIAERLGHALFGDGQFNRAESVLNSVADRSTEPAVRSRARYNAGLSAYKGGRLTDALEDWQRILQEGEHPAATKNAQAVQQEIAKRTNQEPPENQDQDGEPSEDEQKDGEPGEPGESSDPSEGDPSEGQPPPEGDEGEEGETPPPGEGGEITDANPSEAGDSGEAEPPPVATEKISEQEAKRMFDGVEEGTPRVSIDPGSSGGNDW
jgi:Ca-activated chloride channel family protein